MDHLEHSNGHPRHLHEHSDVSVRAIGMFLAALLTGMVVVYVGLLGLWRFLGTVVPQEPSTTALSGPRELPPAPRLQVKAEEELEIYREKERQRISTYGWVDRTAGTVHMPIEKAMDMVLQRGMPVRKEAPAAAKK